MTYVQYLSPCATPLIFLIGSGSHKPKRARKYYMHYDDETGTHVGDDVRRRREKVAAEAAEKKKAVGNKKKKSQRVNYKSMDAVGYSMMRKADWYTAQERDNNIENERFWCREQMYVYRDIYQPLQKACRPMFAHDFEYLRSKPHFNQVVYLLEKLDLVKLAQIQCDYDPQLVIQFFVLCLWAPMMRKPSSG